MNKARPINSPLKQQLLPFLLRWLVSSFAMWVCIELFASTNYNFTDTLWTYILAGLIFSAVNAIVKPFVTLLSLPFIIFTLGLFVLIVNAAMVALTIWLIPGLHIDFGGAILSAIVISVINFLANFLVPGYSKKK